MPPDAEELNVSLYAPTDRERWNAFVASSKNGTFLLDRDYMDYHSDRFVDCSLLVGDRKGLVALLPANRTGDEIHSHQGLTYGGLVVGDRMTTPLALATLGAVIARLAELGASKLHYKTIPHIYHRLPAEEDRYALFRKEARLVRRDVLSVVHSGERGPIQSRRVRGAETATRAGVTIEEMPNGWADYWALLSSHLLARYGVSPVHSRDEIEMLHGRFPAQIRLFVARLDGGIIAGIVVYDSPRVAHVQYIAADEKGRELHALDLLFLTLLSSTFADKPCFDFGISNEQQGRYLNVGLIEQKEGFGGRAVVHDFYDLELG